MIWPGSKYRYSNISYWLLGKIIERATGMAYKDYVIKNIIALLKISEPEMSFQITDPHNHAKGYLARYSFFNMIKSFVIERQSIDQYEDKCLHINNYYPNGPAFGGLVGSARGFAKFLQDQLKEKSCLFDQKTKILFYTQYRSNAGVLVEMTLGWHIASLNGQKFFFKEGGGGGYHSEMRIYPEQGFATIIMVNKTNLNSRNLLNRLAREWLQSMVDCYLLLQLCDDA